jgi:hypothetical protein
MLAAVGPDQCTAYAEFETGVAAWAIPAKVGCAPLGSSHQYRALF